MRYVRYLYSPVWNPFLWYLMRSTNNWNFALASLLIHREWNVPLGKGLKRDLVPQWVTTNVTNKNAPYHPFGFLASLRLRHLMRIETIGMKPLSMKWKIPVTRVDGIVFLAQWPLRASSISETWIWIRVIETREKPVYISWVAAKER